MVIYICTAVVLMCILGIIGILLKNIPLILLGVLFLLISVYLERCYKRLRELQFFLGQLTNTYMIGDIDEEAYTISKEKLINNLRRTERFFYERSRK